MIQTIYKMKSAIEISINNTSGVLILSSKRSHLRLLDIQKKTKTKNEDEKLIGSWLIVNLLNIQQDIFQFLSFRNRSELQIVPPLYLNDSTYK